MCTQDGRHLLYVQAGYALQQQLVLRPLKQVEDLWAELSLRQDFVEEDDSKLFSDSFQALHAVYVRC